jgi:hypothetical protein
VTFGDPWQWVATAIVVGGAVVYLVWKLAVAPRLGAGRKSEGPDVPVDRLTKKKKR